MSMATILMNFKTFSTVGDRWKPLESKSKIIAMFGVFFTLNNQLKAGVHNNNMFNYQYHNWLFGFTLTLVLLQYYLSL